MRKKDLRGEYLQELVHGSGHTSLIVNVSVLISDITESSTDRLVLHRNADLN